MKRVFWLFVLLCSAQGAVFANVPIKSESLLVQYAPKAVLKKAGGDHYTVTLKNIPPYVTYFNVRPNREAGVISIQEYLDLWKPDRPDNFSINPPNASFNAVTVEKGKHRTPINFVAVVTGLVYDSDANTLQYKFKPLTEITLPEEGEIDYMAIFIDDVCLSCW